MKAVTSAGLTPVGPLLQAVFLDYLYGQKRASVRTVESYRDTFRLLLQFLQQTTGKAPTALHTLDMDAPAILRFLDHLERQRHNQAQSRNVRLAAVHSFFRMVAIRDPASVGVATRVLAIPAKRTDKRLLGYLSRPEMDALLNGHDLSQWAGRRDHALLLTLYNTGARVSEMTGLQRSQVQFGTKSFVQFKGKGRKERAVPLWPLTSRTLQGWFAELDADARYRAAVAFPNARGAALSRDGVAYLLQQAVKRSATLCPSIAHKRVTPHLIRHYLPFRTMSGNGMPAQCFRQRREVVHDIILTPSISPMQGKGVHREVYYRLPSSSFASAGRSSRVIYRAVCEVTE